MVPLPTPFSALTALMLSSATFSGNVEMAWVLRYLSYFKEVSKIVSE